ncbi:adenylate/guanylate cyclase domain-containing protein [Sinimarinibacterium sp. CAU 1509]|uniref:adenylate/guanylate cyclase domain-containing protein n=1 Tax=Sinimarinibacterium sp. CAU 1509 TaxID=2562283 RepID=UPI0010ABF8C7|nr:adenylate/guanylate cyclase domain-containing protein [Sinimarinibacterium sp. CAU 1509]TJY58800.1 adenylate/guanylate cyclase domain-containing protein [Sinimarinibacterium sp. CAU 1509]
MDVRSLSHLCCRLLALYFGVEALAGLPPLMADLWQRYVAPEARSLVALAVQHARFGIDLLSALLLWVASPWLAKALSSRIAPAHRQAVNDAAAVVRLGAVMLLVVATSNVFIVVLGELMAGPSADRGWMLAAQGLGLLIELSGGLLLLLFAPEISGWLGFARVEPRRATPVATVAEQASLGELIGDLVGAAGSLGVRRVTELAQTVRAEAEGVARRVVRSSLDSIIAAVELRNPDFSAATAADGTVTIMFSDMEGFTAMTQRLGDQQAHRVIKEHNRVVRRAVAHHDGQEVELQGDGFLLAFADAAKALSCADQIHRELTRYSARHPDTPIRVRIGLHSGTPIKEGDRFFGITVILAARIAAQAHGGETLVSAQVYQQLRDDARFKFDAGREAQLKGLSGSHRMYARC